MGYARHIGRVGALAVALGIGTAIASPPATAWADESGGTATADSPPAGGSTAGEVGGGQDSGGEGVSGDTGQVSVDAEADDDSDDDGDISDNEDISDDGDISDDEGISDEGALQDLQESEDAAALGVGEEVVVDAVGQESPTVGPDSGDDSVTLVEGDGQATGADEAGGADSGAASAPLQPQSAAGATTVLNVNEEVSTAASDDRGSKDAALPLISPLVTSTSASGKETSTGEKVSMDPPAAVQPSLGSVLTTLLSPFTSPTGDDPVDSPLVWGLLAFARRQTVQRSERSADMVATSGALDLAAADPNSSPQQGRITVGRPGLFTARVTGRVRGSDPDGDPLTFAGSGATAKGSVVVDERGRFTYTPTDSARHAAARTGASEQDAVDSFVVTISDGKGGLTPVTVQVPIRPLNDRPNSSGSVGTPNAATGEVRGAVVTDDDDDDTFAYTPTAPAKGSVVFNPDGTFVYTPTQAAREAAGDRSARSSVRQDSFSVSVDDGHGGLDTVRFTVQIAAIDNDAPTAGAVTANQPGIVTGTVSGRVTATDADGDRLTYAGSTTTAKGRVTVTSSGRFTYTPTSAARHAAAVDGANADARTDTFTVTVTDGYGGSTAIPVTVTIAPRNAAPRITRIGASSPNATTGAVTVTVSGRDTDGDTLVFSAPAATAKGTVVRNADGTFTYTPTQAARLAAGAANAPRAALTDSVEITVDDGHGGTDTATVTVRIAPSTATGNTAPTAGSANPGQPGADGKVSGTVTATDPDGDPLTFSGSADTGKGSVIVNSNGTFVYTPTDAARHAASANNAGAALKQDTFTVTVTDGKGGSLTVPVTVAIAPKNAAPTGSANPGTPNASTGVVTGSVTSADADGDPRTYSGPVASAKGGAVTVNSNGTFTYTPTTALREAAARADATAADKIDSFVVTVDDGHLGGVTQVSVTVTIAPATNGAPSGGTVTQSAPDADGKVTGTVTATDPNSDPLTYSGTTTTTKGAVVVTAGGGFTFTPTAAARHAAAANNAAAAVKSDTFTVTVSDGKGGVTAVLVTVPISPANAAPVGGFTSGTPNSATGVVTGTVASTDTDGDTRTYSGPAVSAKGGAVVVNSDGTFTYTPTASAREAAAAPDAPASAKIDTFVATVNDGHAGGITTVTVTVAVAPPAVTASPSVDGAPASRVIVGANGTLYLITTKFTLNQNPELSGATSQVSILAPNGEIVSSTAEIPGIAGGALPVIRPDGTLVIGTYSLDQKTYFSAIDGTGAATTFAPVDGMPTAAVTGADGTVYALIARSGGSGIPTYSLVTLTAANALSTRALDGFPGGYPVVGADGTLYVGLVDPTTSEFSMLVVRPGAEPFSTDRIEGTASFPVLLASDGTAYLLVPTSPARTTVVRVDTSTVDYREAYGYPYTAPIAGPDGSVYYATADGYIIRITGTSITQSDAVGGLPGNVVKVDGAGNAYLLSSDYDTGAARVTRFSAGGITTTYVLSGRSLLSSQTPPDGRVPDLVTIGPDGRIYVPLQVDDGYAVAVIGAGGVERTVPMSARPLAQVVFDADGSPYQVVGTVDEAGSMTGQTAVVNLATGATTAAIEGLPGTPQVTATVAPVVFGPDGTGYLITIDETGTTTRGLVFDATGTTLGSFTETGVAAQVPVSVGSQGLVVEQLVFDGDTAYVVVSVPVGSPEGAKAVVYELSASGATKLTQIDGVYAVGLTVAPDGTLLLTTADLDEGTGTFTTTVRVVTPPVSM